MIKREVKIKGITYQISANSEDNMTKAIALIKRAVKETKKKEEEDGNGI